MSRVRRGTEWTELPASFAGVENENGEPHVMVDLRLPAAKAGETVQLEVIATAIDWGPRVSLRTSPVKVPSNATLELATGILEAAWQQGPVTFVVEACEGESCTSIHEIRMDPARVEDRGWRDASISLARFAGKTVTLAFESTSSPTSAERFSLPVWADPTIRVPGTLDRSAPNVVLLSIDGVGARHLPTYGYFRDTAPILNEQLARRGTVFDACVAAATSTPQAHMSMFTGLQPLEHGITTGMEILDRRIRTVTEQLRASGVATAAITDGDRLGARYGFDRGFDEYEEQTNPSAAAAETVSTLAAASDWLKRHADRRFFLFVHTALADARRPTPAKYADLFLTDEDGDAITDHAPAEVREAQRYDRSIRQVDDELGALLATVDALGLSDSTVFLVISGHGEGRPLSNGVTHVPLLMRGPDIPEGLRIDAPVSQVDLANTIASLFETEPPRESRGIDLRRALRDRGAAADGAFHFTESWNEADVIAPAIAVRQAQRKVARFGRADGSRSSECYDLAEDADERTNRCAGDAPEPADLAAALDAYRETTARRRAALEQSR